jgi:SOS response regulatory protein OraA/RecX
LQQVFGRHLCIEWIDKFNQNNLQSNERFAESLSRGRSNKGIGELKIRNEFKEQQKQQSFLYCRGFTHEKIAMRLNRQNINALKCKH